jgi:FkbM family methyltransferase
MQDGVFEPQETIIFNKIIQQFSLFINIGANAGYYACKALNKGVDVMAFEPNQLNVNILLRNIWVNRFNASVQIFPMALSDKSGILPLYGGSTGASLVEGWAGQKSKTIVPVASLDELGGSSFMKKRCFVLIDIEGAELGCLKGAQNLLTSEANNVFLIEIGIHEHQPDGVAINPNLVETFALMFSFNYLAYTADSNLRKVDLSEVRMVADTKIDTLATHNFLFLKLGTTLKDIGLQ